MTAEPRTRAQSRAALLPPKRFAARFVLLPLFHIADLPMPKPLRAARHGRTAVQTKKLRKVCAFRSFFIFFQKGLGSAAFCPTGIMPPTRMKRGEHISQASFLYGNAVREMRPDSPHFESAVRADVERQHVARVQVAGEDGLRQ